MRIVDAFPHIIPRECMDRFLAVASGPALDFLHGLQGRSYLAPMWDLEARFRSMDAVDGYTQVLTLCL
ncbi:MAG TPA: amidohydrolase, partial [Chloroflexota bacterium]